jgi:hypothetical protein
MIAVTASIILTHPLLHYWERLIVGLRFKTVSSGRHNGFAGAVLSGN